MSTSSLRIPSSPSLSSSKSQPSLSPQLSATATTPPVSASFSARTSPQLTPLQSPSLFPQSPLPSSSSIDVWPSLVSSPVLAFAPLPSFQSYRSRALSDPDSLSHRDRHFILAALPARSAQLQQWSATLLPSTAASPSRASSSADRKLSAPPAVDSGAQLASMARADSGHERREADSDAESGAADIEALPRSSSLLTSSLASLSLQKQQSHSRTVSHPEGSSTAASHTSNAHSSVSPCHLPAASLSSPPHSRSLSQFSQAHPQPHSRPLSSSALLDQLRLSHHHSHLPVHAYTPLTTVLSNTLSSTHSSHARAAFLLTRSYFADPRSTTELLVDTLYTDPPVDLTHERELGQTETRLLAAWRAEKSSALLMLQEWAAEYPEDLSGLTSELVEAMSDWPHNSWRADVVEGLDQQAVRTLASVVLAVQAWEGARAKEQQDKPSPATSPTFTLLTEHPLSPSFVAVPVLSVPLSSSAALYNYSSMLIAQQMTLLTLDRLSLIRPRHLLSKHRNSLPAHLNQMKLSNSVTLFVASHVVTAPVSPSAASPSRVAIFRKWIKVASILFQLGNWNSVFEVLYGLTHHAVWRLRLADGLQSEERDNYSKLCLLVSSDDNYACYRRVKASKERGDGRSGGSAGCLSIPYLGVVLKDLVAMEESQIVLRIGGSAVRPTKKESLESTPASSNQVGSTSRGERSAPSSLSAHVSSFFSASTASSGLSVPSFANSAASASSMDSLSSVHSVASMDGGASVESVESDLFGDDSSGSLTLPSLLSASLLKHSSMPLSVPHEQSPASDPSTPITLPSSLNASVTLTQSLPPLHSPSTLSSSSSSPSSSAAAVAAPLSASSGVLLNWGKLQHIHALVADTLALPSAPYFPPLSDLQQLLLDGQDKALNERQLMEASSAALPRKGRASVCAVVGGGGRVGGEFAVLGSNALLPGRGTTRALRGSSSSSAVASLMQQASA